MNSRFGYTNVLGQSRGGLPLQISRNNKVCTAGQSWNMEAKSLLD